jgi:hypothetical protein
MGYFTYIVYVYNSVIYIYKLRYVNEPALEAAASAFFSCSRQGLFATVSPVNTLIYLL